MESTGTNLSVGGNFKAVQCSGYDMGTVGIFQPVLYCRSKTNCRAKAPIRLELAKLKLKESLVSNMLASKEAKLLGDRKNGLKAYQERRQSTLWPAKVKDCCSEKRV